MKYHRKPQIYQIYYLGQIAKQYQASKKQANQLHMRSIKMNVQVL